MDAPKTIQAPLVRLEDVRLNVPGSTLSMIRTWAYQGKLKTVKVGRRVYVRRADLAAFLGVEPNDLVTAA